MSLRKKASSGLFWTFTQQFGNQIITFVVSIILARLLLPSQFGLIGMISIFVSVGKILLNGGLTASLIRSDNLTQEDYSTVFYFNLFASIIIYAIIYFSAPWIAEFYDQEILILLVRVYAFSFIIFAFEAIQIARLTKKMDFKTQTLIAIPATIVGGLIGVILAYNGYGVWSLVWSYLLTALLSTLQLWFYSKWSPSLCFSYHKFKEHFSFGYRMTLSGILDTIFRNIYLIIIGKYFSAAQVGFYTRADTMKQLPVTLISGALNKVTYPLFSSIRNDNVRLKRIYKELMKTVVYVIAPILLFSAVLAEPIFRFLFTEKWLPAVPYYQILAATGILYPVHAYNLNILLVKGRSDLFLRLAIIKKILTIIGIVIAIRYGILGLLYIQVILSVLVFLVNAHYTNLFIHYSAWNQLKDITPILLLSGLCGIIIWIVDINLKNQLDLIRIISGTIAGSIVYIGLSYLLKLESFFTLKKLVKI